MKILFALLLILTNVSFAQLNLSGEEKQKKIAKLRENVCADESAKDTAKTEAVGACPECAEAAKNAPAPIKIKPSQEETENRELAFFRLMKEMEKLSDAQVNGSQYSVCSSLSACEQLLKQHQDQLEQQTKQIEEFKKQDDALFEDFQKLLTSDLSVTPLPKPTSSNGYSNHNSYLYQAMVKVYEKAPNKATKEKVQLAYSQWSNGVGKYLLDPDLIEAFVKEGKNISKNPTLPNGFGMYGNPEVTIQRIKGVIEGLKDEEKEKRNQKIASVVNSEMQGYVGNVEKWIESISQTRGFRRCDLTPAEIFALMDYSGNGFSRLNGALRAGGQQAAKYEPYKQVLNSAISKLRKYEDFVDRGANLPMEILKQYEVGAIVDSPAFTSTSAFSGFTATHKFSIKTKTGAYIAPFSRASGEEEVLIPAGVKFKVLERTQNGNEVRFVMEEVDP